MCRVCPQCQSKTLLADQKVCSDCERSLDQDREARRNARLRLVEKLQADQRAIYARD